ncbi:purpurin-like [Phlebotomus argentipes]|uniref:purpurin-like n=1 Tax=Phlebotomus argentipes TaxID=94469 RepID=UPI002892CE37|nr:purpurin-like [Phlebotomus argentipes]
MDETAKSFVRTLIVLCSLSAVWSIWVVPGQCPTDRPVQKNFDITKYAGLWYEYLRPDDNYAFLGDCNTVQYTAHANGTVGIRTFRQFPQNLGYEMDETFAVFTDPEQNPPEGRWNISYRWNDPFFANHRILETDYDSYSVTYYCREASPSTAFDDFFIYTRKPSPEPDTKARIDKLLHRFYKMEYLFKQKQGGECHYSAQTDE